MNEIVLNAGAGLATVMMAAFVLYGAWVLGQGVAALVWEFARFLITEVQRLRKAGAR